MKFLSVEDALGPPPAGMDLSENRASKDNTVVITLCVVAVVTVIMRFAVRLRGPKPRPELDDWLMVVAAVSSSLYALIGSPTDSSKLDCFNSPSYFISPRRQMGHG